MAGRPDGVQDTVVGEVGVEPGGDSGWLTTATVLASCVGRIKFAFQKPELDCVFKGTYRRTRLDWAESGLIG